MKTIKEIVTLKSTKNEKCYIEFARKGSVKKWKIVEPKKRKKSEKFLRLWKSHGLFTLNQEEKATDFMVEIVFSTGVWLRLHGVPISFLHIKSYGKVIGTWNISDMWEGKDVTGIWRYRG